MASWHRAHQAHCYSCLPSERHSSSPHQPPPAWGTWAFGHLASTRSCLLRELPWKHTRVYCHCVHCCDSSTGPQNETGSGTLPRTAGGQGQIQIHRARSPSGTRGSLFVSCPLGLWPPSCYATVPSQVEICGAPHGWSTSPVSICFYHQWYMHACMDIPAQEASSTCSMQMPRGTCNVAASWLERQHPR